MCAIAHAALRRGLRVSDPAFGNTAAVTSRITFIDGGKGILRYRGYPIEVLAEKSSFLESAYLLVYGELPTAPKLAAWEAEVMHHTFLHSDIERLLSSFNDNAHPMSVLASSFAALGALAPEANPSLQGQNIYANAAKGDKAALRLMDKQIYRCIVSRTSTAMRSGHRADSTP
jgi:citrate synthase